MPKEGRWYRSLTVAQMVAIAETTSTYANDTWPYGSYVCPRCQARMPIQIMCVCGGGDCFNCCPNECGFVPADEVQS